MKHRTAQLLRYVAFGFLLSFLAMPSRAQIAVFGKNRVQYEDFRWRYIQSTHFDVYYYSSRNYALGEFSAEALEAAYRQISEDFRHEIVDRIEVIIYDSHNDFTQTNVPVLPIDSEGIGGVTDLYKNRITMPFMGDWGDFRRVLHHELVHAVINDMFYGGSLQSIVNGGNRLLIPGWFNEGIAEYSALGWDSNTDSFIRDAVINNYVPPIQRLGGYFAYRGGQSVWNYIVEEYGRQKIGEIFQRIKLTRSVEIGFQQSLGLTIPQLSSRWQAALKERFFPEVAERESITEIGSDLTTQKSGGSYNTSPAISPQGDKVALITNKRGFFDVIVISAIDGKKLKTLIKGEDNVNFEELNILNPNLAWSPDGSKLALSAKSEGSDDLAIVDYQTGKIEKIRFPKVDAIQSVAWSPDGKKIAFDGNMGPLQDVFVYNLETKDFINLTNDVFTDRDPEWGPNSERVYFTSDRGEKVALNTYKSGYDMLLHEGLFQLDLYEVRVGAKNATRLTKTPNWSETQPRSTQNGNLMFISDQNGIPNVYEYNFNTRTTRPLTNLQSGVRQMSASRDGTRLVVNAFNEGYLDVYLIKSPLTRNKGSQLTPNYWAQRRARESEFERVPATGYAYEMFGKSSATDPLEDNRTDEPASLEDPKESVIGDDTLATAQPDSSVIASVEPDSVSQPDKGANDQEDEEDEEIDFRNYVFGEDVIDEIDEVREAEELFNPEENRTEDGRYRPREYRLKFTTDIATSSGQFSNIGAFGFTQFIFSDLLGDHRILFGTNMQLDLRNSDYVLQYAYLKQRTNYNFTFFHTSRQFQTFTGNTLSSLSLIRFRNFGGGLTASYPINKFKRFEYGANVISISRTQTATQGFEFESDQKTFVYPNLTFTHDNTLPGFLTPLGGTRYSLTLNGSPPIPGTLEFVSLIGDFRKYFHLGRGYSFATRFSGGTSWGRDSQSFFMGGMLGWINRRFSQNRFPFEEIEDLFISIPAAPLRGFEYNSIFGDQFGLINAEFRFPLIAALLPGPIPVIPFYNIQGVAFVDFGAAWGQTVQVEQSNAIIAENDAKLDFDFYRETNIRFGFDENGEVQIVDEQNPQDDLTNVQEITVSQNDLLLGSGVGLRTIVFGLPLRYDVGWRFNGEGFTDPIHYITLGIDF